MINIRFNELMNTRIREYNEYFEDDLTGVSSKCDWFVYSCCNDDILQSYIPNLINIKNKNLPKLVFILAYNGADNIKYFFDVLLPDIIKIDKNHLINLIIASNDYTFPFGLGDCRQNIYESVQIHIINYINHQNINKIFVENLDSILPKCIPIPLGMLKYEPGYNECFNLLSKPINFNNKINNVFCCHRNRTLESKQWIDRHLVKFYSQTYWKDFVDYYDELSPLDFIQKLSNSKFCLCVHGGGYDPSPRAWQALCCGTIPIIENSPIIQAYNRFPIIIVDKWTPDCISKDKLDKWLIELKEFYEDKNKREIVVDMLGIDYWMNIFNSFN